MAGRLPAGRIPNPINTVYIPTIDSCAQQDSVTWTPPSCECPGCQHDNIDIKAHDSFLGSFSAPLPGLAYSSAYNYPVRKTMVQRYLSSLPEETDDLTETSETMPTDLSSVPLGSIPDMSYLCYSESIMDSDGGMTEIYPSTPFTPFSPVDLNRPLTEAALSNFGFSDTSLSCASFSSRASTPALSRSLSRSSYRAPRKTRSRAPSSCLEELESGSDCHTAPSFMTTSVSPVKRAKSLPVGQKKSQRMPKRSKSQKSGQDAEPGHGNLASVEKIAFILPPKGMSSAAEHKATEVWSSDDESVLSDTELSATDIIPEGVPGLKECINILFNAFEEWRRTRGTKRTYTAANQPASDKPSTGTSQQGSSQDSTPQSNDKLEGLGDKSRNAQINVSKKRKCLSRPNRTFACPFWKKDARKHRGCGKLTLRRVKDVKQHLNRSRAHKPHYCPCCYETFPTRESLDNHSRARSCPLRSPRSVEGLTEQQSSALQRRVDRRLSDEEQWYCMWDIIFPNSPRPLTPYIDSDLSEDLAEFREFTLSGTAAEIFLDYLATHGYQFTAPSTGRQRTGQIISGGLDMVYNQWLSSSSLSQGSVLRNQPMISPPDSNSTGASPEVTRHATSETDLAQSQDPARREEHGMVESIMPQLVRDLDPLSPVMTVDDFGDFEGIAGFVDLGGFDQH